MQKNNVNIEELLKTKWKIAESQFNDFYTKCHFFLMPLLNAKILNDKNFKKHYINSYIDDEERRLLLEGCILLHFKTTDIYNDLSPTWDDLFNTIENSNNCRYYYYTGNNSINNEAVVALEIPKEYINDYKLILSGKYSQTSQSYKRKILHYFSKYKDLYNTLRGVLYKEEWIKKEIEAFLKVPISNKNEFWDRFSTEREVFRWKNKKYDSK